MPMNRLFGSARVAGVIVLAVPALLGVGLRLFPNYDARSEYFASSYSKIVAADVAFPVSLVVLAATALLLGVLVLALRRVPQSVESASGLVVARGSLGVAAMGLLASAALSIPVWLWSRQVRSGELSFSEGADKSQPWATASQTLILLVGLGSLLVAFSALGIVAYRAGWTPPVVFWTTMSVVAAGIVGGFALSLFWIALGLPPILWTLMIGGSLVIKGRYNDTST